MRSSLEALRAVPARWRRAPLPLFRLTLPCLPLSTTGPGATSETFGGVCRWSCDPLASVLKRRMVVDVKLDRGRLRVADVASPRGGLSWSHVRPSWSHVRPIVGTSFHFGKPWAWRNRRSRLGSQPKGFPSGRRPPDYPDDSREPGQGFPRRCAAPTQGFRLRRAARRARPPPSRHLVKQTDGVHARRAHPHHIKFNLMGSM